MFEAAENRKLDVLVFWSPDRFSREGIRKTISFLQEREAFGVGFRSYAEPYLNTEGLESSRWQARGPAASSD